MEQAEHWPREGPEQAVHGCVHDRHEEALDWYDPVGHDDTQVAAPVRR